MQSVTHTRQGMAHIWSGMSAEQMMLQSQRMFFWENYTKTIQTIPKNKKKKNHFSAVEI